MQIKIGTGSKELISFVTDDRGRVAGFIIPTPSNFHAHLRFDALMRAIADSLMRHVYYLLLMPNVKLRPNISQDPILTLEQLERYYMAAMYQAVQLKLYPRLVMTIYYSNLVTPAFIGELVRLREKLDIQIDIKAYPPEPNMTTGSGHGIPLDPKNPVFAEMARSNVRLLVHPESDVGDFFAGEAHFFNEVLRPFRDIQHKLSICGEHVNTADGVRWVQEDTSGRSHITITPHGSLCGRSHLLGPYGPLFTCKTRLQTPLHQAAVRAFMVTGDPRASAGDDTAAHLKRTKFGVPVDQVSNGAFWPWIRSVAAYARVFSEEGGLGDPFVEFLCHNGARWRGLPLPGPADKVRFVIDSSAGANPILVPEEDDVVLPVGWSTGGDLLELGLRCDAV